VDLRSLIACEQENMHLKFRKLNAFLNEQLMWESR